MIRILLKKDLRRARRNPWPYLINLALPFVITMIIGLAFGNSGSGQGIGKIKIGITDEDDGVLGQILANSFSQGDAQDFMSPVFLKREEALNQIQANELSAVLIIPENFTTRYLEGDAPPPLELVKNPAQRYHPAIMEEFLGIIVEGLNVVSRNFKDEIPEIVELAKTDGYPDMIGLAAVLVKLGVKFKKAEDFLFPPLITFTETTERDEENEKNAGFNIFAFLLPMLSSVFLLYLADGSVRDIYKELSGKTLPRIKTVHYHLLPVVISKCVLAVITGIVGSAIWFIGGGLAFQIEWQAPGPIILLVIAYSICAAGFMAVLVGLFRTEKQAETLISLVILGIAFLGGGFIQVDAMPEFIREQISPWMPNYWFIQSVQSLQFERGNAIWSIEAIKMLGVGILCLIGGTYWINRNMEQGHKS